MVGMSAKTMVASKVGWMVEKKAGKLVVLSGNE